MTAGKAFDCQPTPAQCAVCANGRDCVLAAGGVKTTGRRREGGDDAAVDINGRK